MKKKLQFALCLAVSDVMICRNDTENWDDDGSKIDLLPKPKTLRQILIQRGDGVDEIVAVPILFVLLLVVFIASNSYL